MKADYLHTRHFSVAEALESLYVNHSLIERMQKLAKENNLVLIVPMYEEESAGVYYNTAAVIESDGTLLGKFRKMHIPHLDPGFWEKFYFRPGNLGYPVFETSVAKIGVYICYDRHFPEGARALALNGAEIVFNPSATVAGLSEHLRSIEQPAHAVANGYFMAAINRVGEEPWKTGTFYGSSYIADPRGQMVVKGSRDKEELVVGDVEPVLDKIIDQCLNFKNPRSRLNELLDTPVYICPL